MTCAAILLIPITELSLWAAVGMLGGLVLFCRGFLLLQRKRLILNTPNSKIRSASLGFIEVNGLATGPYVIPAPITGKACYYYRSVAWQLQRSGKNQEWRKVADESLHVPFFLDDGTGMLLVNPQGAETDLHRDFQQEYGGSFFSSDDVPLAVRAFLLKYGVTADHKVRVEEYCIKPKNALFILGTLAENTGVQPGPIPIATAPPRLAQLEITLAPRDKIIGVVGERTPESLIRSGQIKPETEQEIINLSSAQQALTAAEMTQQGKIAAALLKAGIRSPAAWSAAGIENAVAAVAVASSGEAGTVFADGGGSNPAATPELFDRNPKVVLMKGDNNPAFFISWRSQREVVSSLGWKATAYIWGGPALTLTSAYILLSHWQWL